VRPLLITFLNMLALKSSLLVRLASYFNVAASKRGGGKIDPLWDQKYRSKGLTLSTPVNSHHGLTYIHVQYILFLFLRELYACISCFICTFVTFLYTAFSAQ